jgi:hypothetical protein
MKWILFFVIVMASTCLDPQCTDPTHNHDSNRIGYHNYGQR